jgi:EpsD family peptidyl-prolyl cis-trans isomerase
MDISRVSAIICVGAIAAVGCTRNADQEPASTGQVVARVGNEVVTTLELRNELRLANVPQERINDSAIIKQALNEMVLRKYLVQQAVSSKMDQEPNVLSDIRRAREQTLANVFMARKAASISITRAEVDKYIAQNPAKFADRIMLTIDQVRFALGPNIQDIVESNKGATSLDEVERKLTSMGIPNNRSVGALSQADLPQEVAKALQARKAGEVFFGRLGPNGLYFEVKSAEARPLEGEDAANFARQSLRADSMKTELSLASVSARQEAHYEGEYAKIMAVTDKAADRAPSAAAPAVPVEPTASGKN